MMPYFHQPSVEELAPLPFPLVLTGIGRDATSVSQILKEQAMAKKVQPYLNEAKRFKLFGWLSGITQQHVEDEKLSIHWFLEESTKVVGENVDERIVRKYMRMANLVPYGFAAQGKKQHFSQLAELKDRVARLEHAVFDSSKATN